jgi:hypothetical protein
VGQTHGIVEPHGVGYPGLSPKGGKHAIEVENKVRFKRLAANEALRTSGAHEEGIPAFLQALISQAFILQSAIRQLGHEPR